MKAETVKQIVEAGEYIGLAIEAFENYSGRGMFGETTGAVVVGGVGDFAAAVAQATITSDDPYELVEECKTARSDSLGHDLIIY